MPESLNSTTLMLSVRDIDLRFARFMRDLSAGDEEVCEAVYWAALLASAKTAAGHTALELQQLAGRNVVAMFNEQRMDSVTLAELPLWCERLHASAVVGSCDEAHPLMLDGERLYLGRYWAMERTLARNIQQRLADSVEADPDTMCELLDTLFPDEADGSVNGQKVAAIIALLQRFCVISGGPGTGKTTTVTRILLLLKKLLGDELQRIMLVAPTGKAAARLVESLKKEKARLSQDGYAEYLQGIPDEASTIHRLLGIQPGQVAPRYHRANPLPLDLILVDEASMIDLPLMQRLLDAVPQQARVIILGDRDQLASVEAGSVLADLCGHGRYQAYRPALGQMLQELAGRDTSQEDSQVLPEMADHIAVLHKSYRFDQQSGIGRLATAVNGGDLEAVQVLAAQDFAGELQWLRLDPQDMEAGLKGWVQQHYSVYLQHKEPAMALQAFMEFQVLCALREGPFGVQELNLHIESLLTRYAGLPGGQRFYHGRPIMITRNDYHLNLFNGDIGLLFQDPEQKGKLYAWFQQADGSLRAISPARLPQHETVFAMTIHKSQGSEFNTVMLVLPDIPQALLTRELIYTGITRAREHIILCAEQHVLADAIGKRVQRESGLMERLWC